MNLKASCFTKIPKLYGEIVGNNVTEFRMSSAPSKLFSANVQISCPLEVHNMFYLFLASNVDYKFV